MFEVPLAFFLEAENRRQMHLVYRGRTREVFEYLHGGERIWGATAAMLWNLTRRLEASA